MDDTEKQKVADALKISPDDIKSGNHLSGFKDFPEYIVVQTKDGRVHWLTPDFQPIKKNPLDGETLIAGILTHEQIQTLRQNGVTAQEAKQWDEILTIFG